MTSRAKDFIQRYLDTNGDGTGTKNAIGNYASAATQFKIKPPVDTVFYIFDVHIQIGDEGAGGAEDYGNDPSLTNGIEAKIFNGNDNVVVDMTDGVPVKRNADWGRFCDNVQNHDWGTTPAEDFVTATWSFRNSGGPVLLNGDAGEYFAFILNDNFTTLVSHYFMVQGFQEKL